MDASTLTPWDDDTDLRTIGAGRPRVEAGAKVTGAAVYSADVRLPGQLQVAVARSPHPHARIRSVDTAAALRVPGVVDVITVGDDEGITWYEEQVPLFSPVARFVGDEVAAVAATTMEAARDGVRALVVDFEVLPHVVDLDLAGDPGQPSVHGTPGNRTDEPREEVRGDPDLALAAAPVMVEATYRTPTAIHNALEPHGTVAWWRADRLTLHASTQGINQFRSMLADALGLDHSRVRVLTEHVGGGFGAKQVPWKDAAIAALLSRRTGRPVQCRYDRSAENTAAGKRGATVQRVRLGADTDGRLLAIDAELTADAGAYQTAGEAAAVYGPYEGLYRCANVRTATTFRYTHTGPAVAFRAPGYVEAAFALESAMDELAHRLGLDPIELRRRNHSVVDQAKGVPLSSPDALLVAYERVAARSGWSQRPGAADTVDPGSTEDTVDPRSTVRRGWGFAANDWLAGKPSPPGYALVVMADDGSVEVGTTAQDIGTGTRTVLAQVAAEELDVDPAQVQVRLGDTAGDRPAPTSSGSATTPTMAPAVRAAAAEARHRLVAAAAEQLGCPPGDVRLDRGKLISTDGRVRSVPEVLEELSPAVVNGSGELVAADSEVAVKTFGAAVAEVEVDTATGEIRVCRLVIAPDCGRILNPTLVDSQVIGAATQAIGFALTESQLLDPALGIVVNNTLEEYLVPTVIDTSPIEHAQVDRPDPAANALGAKGIGEPPMIPVAPAIANAVHDAIGVRFRTLPITRAAVLDALNGATS